MASQLKRKRDPVKVLDAPKRSKSITAKSENPLRTKLTEKVGWAAAFDPPATAELVRTDGVNGDSKILDKDVASPDAVEYDQYVKEESQKFSQSVAAEDSTSLNGGTALKEANRKAGQARILGSKRVKALKKRSIDPWKLSESIGGRMVNAEPVFADDEKCVALLSMECC